MARLGEKWQKTKLRNKQVVLFLFMECLLVLLLVTNLAMLRAPTNAIMRERAVEELRLLESDYNTKLERLDRSLARVSTHNAVRALVANPRDSVAAEGVLRLLDDLAATLYVETLYLTDSNGAVIASARNVTSTGRDDNRVAHTAGRSAVSRVLAADYSGTGAKTGVEAVADSTVHSSVTLTHAEYASLRLPVIRERRNEFHPVASDHMHDTSLPGIVRYVAAPVFADHAAQHATADAALLAGDLVNGKVSIVEETTVAFDSGYSGVWFDIGDGASFAQAASFTALDLGADALAAAEASGSSLAVEIGTAFVAGQSIVDTSVVAAAFRAPADDPIVTSRTTAGGFGVTVAAMRLPDTPVVLVRGASEAAVASEVSQLEVVLVLVTVGLILIDSVVLYSTVRSFTKPLEMLQRMLKKREDATNAYVATKRREQRVALHIDQLPTKRQFMRRGVCTNMMVLVAFVVVGALNFTAVRDLLELNAKAQVKVMQHEYGEKQAQMQLEAHALAARDDFVQVVRDWGQDVVAGRTGVSGAVDAYTYNNSAAFASVRARLGESLQALRVDVALIIDSNDRVIVTGDGDAPDFRRDQFFDVGDHITTDAVSTTAVSGADGGDVQSDAQGLVASIFSEPKTVKITEAMPVSLFRRLDVSDKPDVVVGGDGRSVTSALSASGSQGTVAVRWVAVPITLPESEAASQAASQQCGGATSADAVIVLGDVVNGKLELPKLPLDLMPLGGYAAVYAYEVLEDDYTLVSSLVQEGDGERYWSDIALSDADTAVLDAARDSADGSATGAVTLNVPVPSSDSEERPFAVGVQAVSIGSIVDQFGERSLVGHNKQVLLVTGVPGDHLGDEVVAALLALLGVGIAALIIALAVRMALVWLSYKPAKGLVDTLVRFGFIQKNSSGTGSKSGSGEASGSGSTSGSGTASGSNSGSSSQDDSSLASSLLEGLDLANMTPKQKKAAIAQRKLELMHWSRRAAVVCWRKTKRTCTSTRRLGWVVATLAIVAVLVEIAVIYSQSEAASSDAEKRRVSELSELITACGNMVHKAGQERGQTAWMIDSGWDQATRMYVDDAGTEEARRDTDAAAAPMRASIAMINSDDSFVGVHDSAVTVESLLLQKDAWRRQVANNGFSSGAASTDYWTDLNNAMIQLVADALQDLNDTETLRAAYAELMLLQVMEALGLTRARLLLALTNDGFTDASHFTSYLSTKEEVEWLLMLNNDFAPADVLAQQTELVNASRMAEIRLIMDAAGTYPADLSDEVYPTPEQWWALATAVIDDVQVAREPLIRRMEAEVQASSTRAEDRVWFLIENCVLSLAFVVGLWFVNKFTRRVPTRTHSSDMFRLQSRFTTSPRRLVRNKTDRHLGAGTAGARGMRQGAELTRGGSAVGSGLASPSYIFGSRQAKDLKTGAAKRPQRGARVMRRARRRRARRRIYAAMPAVFTCLFVCAVVFQLSLLVSLTTNFFDAEAKLEKLQKVLTLARTGGDYIHGAGIERGMASVMVGSGYNETLGRYNDLEFVDELAGQQAINDAELLGPFRADLTNGEVRELSGISAAAFDDVLATVDGVVGHRRAYEVDHSLSVLETADYYTQLNAKVVLMVNGLSRVVVDAQSLRDALAYTAYLRSKEGVQVQRAVGAGQVSQRRWSGDEPGAEGRAGFTRFVAAAEQYRANEKAYLLIAPRELREASAHVVAGADVDATLAWTESMYAFSSLELQPPDVPAEVRWWFWNMTSRIDKMQGPERAMVDDMVSRIDANYDKAIDKVIGGGVPSAVVLALLVVALVLFCHGYRPVRVKFHNISEVLMDPPALQVFLRFCESEHNEENLLFWMRVSQLAEVGDDMPHDVFLEEATRVYDDFVKPGAEWELGLDHTTKQEIKDALATDAHPGMYQRAEFIVLENLVQNSWLRFSRSRLFRRFVAKQSTKQAIVDRQLQALGCGRDDTDTRVLPADLLSPSNTSLGSLTRGSSLSPASAWHTRRDLAVTDTLASPGWRGGGGGAAGGAAAAAGVSKTSNSRVHKVTFVEDAAKAPAVATPAVTGATVPVGVSTVPIGSSRQILPPIKGSSKLPLSPAGAQKSPPALGAVNDGAAEAKATGEDV